MQNTITVVRLYEMQLKIQKPKTAWKLIQAHLSFAFGSKHHNG